MTVIYDKFIRLGGTAGPGLPQIYPYTITMLMEDGTFKEQTIRSHRDLDLRKAISVKIHTPVDPLAVLTQDIVKHMGFLGPKTPPKVEGILQYLEGRGLLKVHGEPLPKRDWLDEKLDDLGIHYKASRNHVRNWFDNPTRFQTCDDILKSNQILTVKPSGGGRVIVLPTGHTLAYTTAREIYSQMIGKSSYLSPYCRASVGEYRGQGNWHYNSNHRLKVNKDGVTVGCQVVSRQAIDDLAEREGWA